MNKYPRLKKCLVVGIILLFVGTGIIPSIAQDGEKLSLSTSSGKWLYVGGSGPGNYTTIQSAINAARSGDTVFVYSGTYSGNIVINKTINLIGEDKHTTIIEGDSYDYNGVYVISNNINITNIQITTTHEYSIVFQSVKYSSIVNCIIHSSLWNGTLFFNCTNCIISHCDIYDVIIGIVIRGSCSNVTILDCNISNGFGIWFGDSGIKNFIIGCNFYSDSAIYLYPTCYGNIFYHNNFLSNSSVFDEGNNKWYNVTMQEGNYWSDYTGTDANNDGIGDTPYKIPGGSNQDLFPFMQQNGWLLRPNLPPNPPSNPNPVNHGTNVNLNVVLSWACSDPNIGDTLTYDVYFGLSPWPSIVSSGQTTNTYHPGVIYTNTKYCWRILAKDNHGGSTIGPLWDFTTTSRGNNPPNIPSNPSPLDQATDVDISTKLSWTGGDPDVGDTATYDVWFGSMLPLSKVASNISTPSYTPGLLANDLTYMWVIEAWDNHGLSNQGPVWWFTTIAASSNPPDKPSTPIGRTTGKINVEYTYTSITFDPDGDQVYYLWDWGDGNNSGWLGIYNSGTTCEAKHTWNTKDNYNIKVKAKDIYGKESSWSDPLRITMPYSYKPILRFLELLFERFPHAFPLLQQLSRY
jgi:Periplasmic copper-binding protein (NosD)/PKD domain